MKVIDLLNTPLDKLPKKIKVEDRIYTLWINEANQHYYHYDKCLFSISCFDNLNEEIEIIEEEKGIPEKLEEYIYTDSLNYNQCNYMFEKLTNKYNEIIDYLQSRGEQV